MKSLPLTAATSRVGVFRNVALLLATAAFTLVHGAELRVGMLGLDTSHATAFTEILADTKAKDYVPGARVVGAVKGGSPDIESSWSRVEGYTKTLVEKHGVKLYDHIEDLSADVDAIMIESVDGRPHLGQFQLCLKAGKPVFIDKPLAGTLKDAIQIFRLAQKARVPMFTASSLRYGKNTQAVRNGAIGTVTNAVCWSPAHLEPHHPDLFWYGIHGCESLFTVMGPGCQSVRRTTTPDGKIEVIGRWKDGRTGTFRENDKGYGGIAQGTRGELSVGAYDGYAPLVVEIVKFYQTKVSPVEPKETLEIFAFMEAADESKRRGGAEVTLKEVLAKAGY